jgi:heterodisulfide reductase subunit C
MTASATAARAPTFMDEVTARTPGEPHLERCIQCGTCGGSCPSGADMEHTPRGLFALITAGLKDQVLRSNTPWYCVSCYYCTVRCPQQIHITDLMYTLKRMAIDEGFYTESTARVAPDFSKTFIDLVESNGRSFEMGLATVHVLRHRPLSALGMMPMALGLLRRGRMDLIPTKIKGIKQLQAILARAKELGGAA